MHATSTTFVCCLFREACGLRWGARGKFLDVLGDGKELELAVGLNVITRLLSRIALFMIFNESDRIACNLSLPGFLGLAVSTG